MYTNGVSGGVSLAMFGRFLLRRNVTKLHLKEMALPFSLLSAYEKVARNRQIHATIQTFIRSCEM